MAGPIDPTQLEQIGRYRVRRFHAHGGMSWVFEVTDPDVFNARRALKLMKPGAAIGDEAARFESEARLLATLEHPNLVNVYDFGIDPTTGYQFYTMEFLDASDLSAVVPEWLEDAGATRRGRPDTLEDICGYFEGVLLALHRMHTAEHEGQLRPIFHRDIKPANIFLSGDGIAKLGDLGIAKSQGSSGLTTAGGVIGTALYMSPEQSMGEELDARSDLFSLGLTLYHVLSGETVYDAVDGLDTTNVNKVVRHLWQIQRDHQELDFDFPDEVPDSICDVVRKACRIDAGQRYQDALEMRAALRQALREAETYTSPRPAVPAGLVRNAALAFGALALIVVGYLAFPTGEPPEKTEAELAQTGAIATQAQLTTLMKSLLDVSDPGAREAHERAQTGFERAEFSAREAKRDMEEANYLGATRRFGDAKQGYDHVCNGLRESYLEGAAATRVESARVERQRIPEAAAPYAAEGIADLDRQLGALGGTLEGEGCVAARQLDDRIVLAAAVPVEVENILAMLAESMPAIATEELARADKARETSRADAGGDTASLALLAEAESQLEEARALESRKSYVEAIDTAKLAIESFGQTRNVAECGSLRQTATELVAQADKDDLTIGTLRLQYNAAQQAHASKEYSLCAEEFGGVVNGLQGLLIAAGPALASQKEALIARSDARNANVPEAQLDGCYEALSNCQTKMSAQRFAQAAADCDSATAACTTAKASWNQEKVALVEQAEALKDRLASTRGRANGIATTLTQSFESARSRGLPIAELETRMQANLDAIASDAVAEVEEAETNLERLSRELAELDREATPALAARTEAFGARTAATSGGVQSTLLASAEDAYKEGEARIAAGNWLSAKSAYDLASERYGEATEAAGELVAARSDATTARKAADEGLSRIRSAGLVLGTEPTRYYETARADFEAERYKDAIEGYRIVESEATSLRERAKPVLGKKQAASRSRTELASKGANDTELSRGDGLRKRGDESLKTGDLDAAARAYDGALAAYRDTGKEIKARLDALAKLRAGAQRARTSTRGKIDALGIGLGSLSAERDKAEAHYKNGRFDQAEAAFKTLGGRVDALAKRVQSVRAERDKADAEIRKAAGNASHQPEKLAAARSQLSDASSRLQAGQLDSARSGFAAATASARAALPRPEDYAKKAVENWNRAWDEENIDLLQSSWQMSPGDVESLSKLFNQAEITQKTTISQVRASGSGFEITLRYDRYVDNVGKQRRSQKSGRALVANAGGSWKISNFTWE